MKNPNQNNPIHFAVAVNDIIKLKHLIASGASIEKKSSLGDTPLILSAKKGNLEAFKVLIEAGANIDAVDNYKQSSLYYAVTKFSIAPPINRNDDYSDMTAILIEKGAKTPSMRLDPEFFAKTLETLNVRHDNLASKFLKNNFHKEIFHIDPNYINTHINKFLNNSNDSKSLKETLEKLINVDFTYENKIEAITHLAHLNSWTGEIVDLDHQIDAEGWLMHRYPPLKVKSLLKSLKSISNDKINAQKMFGEPKNEIIKKIKNEITAQLTTYYTQVNQDTIKSIDTKSLKNQAVNEEVSLICKKIFELKPNQELAIASGFPGHAIYIGFRKNSDSSINKIIYNLGGGIKNNHIFSDTGRVYPDVVNHIPISNFKNLDDCGSQYIKGIIESKLGMHKNFLNLIYAPSKDIGGIRITKEFTQPAQKRQLAGNCVLKNNNAAIRNRLKNDKLFKWLKHQEIQTATKVSDLGDLEINAKENAKDLLSLNYIINEYNRTKNLDAVIVNFNMFFKKRLNLTNTNHKDEKSKLNDFVKTNKTNPAFKKWMKDTNVKKMLDLALENDKIKTGQVATLTNLQKTLNTHSAISTNNNNNNNNKHTLGINQNHNRTIAFSTCYGQSSAKNITTLKKEDTLTNISIRKIKDPMVFQNAIISAKQSNPHSAFVHAYSSKEYAKMNLFLINDGVAGVAVKQDGDIVSIFKNVDKAKAQNIKNVAGTLISTALKNGGKKLDAFNGFLPNLYVQYGFVPVCSSKFDKRFAPSDWNYKRDGMPDVILFKHNGDSVAKINKKQGDYPKFEDYNIPTFPNLNMAEKYRQQQIKTFTKVQLELTGG